MERMTFTFQNEFKLARVGNNVPRGTLDMGGRCQLKFKTPVGEKNNLKKKDKINLVI
jgi:hypothetical protein